MGRKKQQLVETEFQSPAVTEDSGKTELINAIARLTTSPRDLTSFSRFPFFAPSDSDKKPYSDKITVNNATASIKITPPYAMSRATMNDKRYLVYFISVASVAIEKA